MRTKTPSQVFNKLALSFHEALEHGLDQVKDIFNVDLSVDFESEDEAELDFSFSAESDIDFAEVFYTYIKINSLFNDIYDLYYFDMKKRNLEQKRIFNALISFYDIYINSLSKSCFKYLDKLEEELPEEQSFSHFHDRLLLAWESLRFKSSVHLIEKIRSCYENLRHITDKLLDFELDEYLERLIDDLMLDWEVSIGEIKEQLI